MYTRILKHTVFSWCVCFSIQTQTEQEVPSANRRSQIKHTNVVSTRLFATSMYTQHVHHSILCITACHVCLEGTRTAGTAPRKLQSFNKQFYKLMPLPLGFLVQSAPQQITNRNYYSFCLLYPQPGASESRGSQPGLCSASRTRCWHFLHARVKDLSIHQALTRLELNRQSLTSNRIHDQSQSCRNTGKVAVGKAPGNNRWLCTRVRQALPRATRRP